MKAIILAAGKATRLLPLTIDTPQCLLKIGDKTILEKQVATLNACKIEDIVVVVGYLSDKIKEVCEKKKIRPFFNPFYSVSGMAATLWVVKDELKDGFFSLYSDIMFEKLIINNLLNCKGDFCLAIKKDNLREEAEKVIEEKGTITAVSKTGLMEKANAEFIGLAKFSRAGAEIFINEMEEILKNNINANFIDIIQSLIDKGYRISGCDIGASKCIDIDFERDLKLAEKFFS